MTTIQPFTGIRPRPDVAAEIASPPYDVLDRQEVTELLGRRPQSFMRVLRPEVLLNPDLDPADPTIYAEGRRNLQALRDEGLLLRDEAPSLYLYEQTMGDHQQVGLVAGVASAEYFAGLIKKHEHTRTKDLDDRVRHIEALGVNTGPVFLTYYAKANIDALIARLTATDATYDFVAEDAIRHRFWVINNAADISALQEAFASVPALYIADGHHRTDAGCQVGKRRAEKNPTHRGDEPYNFVMAVIFPHDQINILAYNRVVKDLAGHTPETFKEAMSANFTIDDATAGKPTSVQTFGMFLDGRWYRLTPKAGTFDASDRLASLDVAILQNNLLDPLLGIKDPKKDPRIEFVGGIRGAKELERRATAHGGVAFYCYPTQMAQVMEIADAGEVMPPKSTWVEPKLRSGLIVRSIDD
ncbi:MAG: DUF1015 domain-containing protein [Deltaproteobacteria bacterium]|nr:DUF1015 domain-containing protein [Deltaproteobacteria bacterium]